MKFSLIFSAAVILLSSAAAQQYDNEKWGKLTVTPVSDNIYLAVHLFPWPANSVVIKSGDELLFIDTPYNDEASEELYRRVTGNEDYKIKVINSHFHSDNLGGNGFFRNISGKIYGSDMTVQLLKERGAGIGVIDSYRDSSMKKYFDYYTQKKFIPPDNVFPINEEQVIKFGEDSVIVYYPGPGHSPDNIVVYHPQSKLLFGGCLIKSHESKTKGNTGDAVLEKWPHSIRNVMKRFPEAEIVIPGHGSIGNKDLFEHSIKIVISNE